MRIGGWWAALGALAAGVACGSALRDSRLPAAGSDRDDGSGLLARASHDFYTRGAGEAPESYGGASYGGSAYGGGRYANYQLHIEQHPSHSEPNAFAPGYSVTEIRRPGAIAGRLAWDEAPAADRLVGAGCPAPGAAEAPRHAVVSLRGPTRGRGYPDTGEVRRRWQVGGLLQVRRCRIDPYVQVVGPLGAVLAVRSLHRAALEVTARPPGGERVTLELGSPGDQRYAQLTEPGVFEIEAGSERAWVIAAGHPYHVVTDEDGSFVIGEVPPGRYRLAVWHPPLAAGGEPIEIERAVVVRGGRTTEIELELPGR